MEEILRAAVNEALSAMGAPEVSFAIEWPADTAHGDYATNAALAAGKELQKNPRELAEELAVILRTSLSEEVERIEVAGPGFINFTLARTVIAGVVGEAAVRGSEWGKGNGNEGKRVMLEYSNPNPFKEIHIGHLMSNVVGEAFSRILENAGTVVLRDTFGGDVGPHVAKALWALRRNGVTDIAHAAEIGKAYAQGSTAYEESEEAKREIDDLNTRIYEVVAKHESPDALTEENRELLTLWRKGREVSMEEFFRIFKLLGTSFDYVFFDSDTTAPGMEAVRQGLTQGIFEESDGAIIYRGEKKGLHTLVFITSRGTPTYETKDIGLALIKEERAATDENIIVTAVEQVGHFQVVLAALEELIPSLAAKTRHLPHGLLRLPEGKMSSRKGNVITGADLIEEMTGRAGEKNDDPVIAQQVAIGAIKYMILRQAPGGDIVFDPERSLSLDGDSGPYLQYALVRARSVLAQAPKAPDAPTPSGEPFLIERLLVRFPAVTALAARENAPHKVTQYLTLLAGEWNSFYAKERIIGGEHEGYKLVIAKAFATTMENGLRLLAIPAPEKM